MVVFNSSSHLPISATDALDWLSSSASTQRSFPIWEPFDRLKEKCKTWNHQFNVHALSATKSKLDDHLEFELTSPSVKMFSTDADSILSKAFAFRHRTMINDLFLHSLYSKTKLKILVTGSSGFVATSLIPFLLCGGHTVITLKHTDLNSSGFKDTEKFENLDAVVHLAGANIAEKRWTAKRKQELIDSRIAFTESLCAALTNLKNPPRSFVAASGIGIFGDRDNSEILTEDSKVGDGFLANLAHDWELASLKANQSKIRVVHLRFGAILASHGGFLKKLLPVYQLGMGGPVGPGTQMMPWISLSDVLGLILFCLSNKNIAGPVNAVSSGTIDNQTFSNTLSEFLDKPNAIRVPSLAIKLGLGEMGESLLLYSQNAVPKKALDLGYDFIHSELKDAFGYWIF